MRKINFRWIICALLFFATMVNYLDRQVLSLTWKDFIAPEFHWNDDHYGTITSVFALIYAICNLFAGKVIDWMGTKKGYLWAIFVWSAAACLHAFCGWATIHVVDGVGSVAALKTVEAGSALALAIASTSVWLFLGCRALLAIGEAGNFPSAVKVTAEYFPKKDRAFATSIFNAGSSVGALIAPIVIGLIARAWGWEAAFIVIGALGFLWMGLWQILYDNPEKSRFVSPEELTYIRQDDAAEAAPQINAADEKGISYLQCFKLPQTWSLICGRVLTDGVWWFFLFWTPGYLSDQFGYRSDSGMEMALIFTLYAIVTFVSIYLCRLPTWFVEKRGMNPYEGRMRAMLFFACIPLLALAAQPLGTFSAWYPAILIGLACAGHQAWSANLYSVVGDMFPRSCIGTLTGIAQFAAGVGSFIVNKSAGRLFTYAEQAGDAFAFCGYHGKPAGYMVLFTYCAVAYLIGWMCMKTLVPRYRKVEL